MEITIDRSSYRRSAKKVDSINKKAKSSYKKVFLNEIIVAMAVLIGILIVKYVELNEAISWIKNEINSGMSVNELYMYIEDFYNGIKSDVLIATPTYYAKKEIKIEPATDSIEINLNLKEDYDSNDTAQILKNEYEIISPLTDGVITSKFGYRESDNPIVSNNHCGLDIAANKGTPIYAAHKGKIVNSGWFGTYGNCIMIENGELTTVYAHCDTLKVKVGDTIEQGVQIGTVGSTGNSTGPHLHFEIRYKEEFINPEDII